MNEQTQDFAGQGAAFQKIWLESMSKLMQAAFTFSPNSTPPEILRDIRSGIFQALGESWNEFLRSPQFQKSMKQWMDQAVAFREMTGDFMAKVRKDMQAPSRDDIDSVLLNLRHLETRVLDRLDALSKQVDELNRRAEVQTAAPAAEPPASPRPRKAKTRTRRRSTSGRV